MIIDTHPPKIDEPAIYASRKEWIMRKITKWLLISIASLSLGWSSLASIYTFSVADDLTTLRKENRSDVSHLRNRIRELEAELSAYLLDHVEQPTIPTGGEPESSPSTETTMPEDTTESMRPEDTTDVATEEVTIPTHQSPETEASNKIEADTIPTLYLVAERNGIIGLFDSTGNLMQATNVFVMTLPEADRKILSVGIPANTLDEALSILEQYE